jgi:hypothetical protein
MRKTILVLMAATSLIVASTSNGQSTCGVCLVTGAIHTHYFGPVDSFLVAWAFGPQLRKVFSVAAAIVNAKLERTVRR